MFAKTLNIFKIEGISGIKRILNIIQNNTEISPGPHTNGHDRNNYREWIQRYDLIDEALRSRINEHILNFRNPPKISVLMPTYNPKSDWLIQAIISVQRQLYPHWELCIADDASTDITVRILLERFAQQDKRIKVDIRSENGHISAASNSAFALATGEWVALLDQDDLLSEHALFFVADIIIKRPEAKVIYSDEDKVDSAGNRYRPYFKCDWNPDLFYSHNMISHLGVYHKDLVEKIGGFRSGFEGAQDYDLALRCIESAGSNAVVHIPRVLYHWRVHAGSTASSAAYAKPYAMLAGERALKEHFHRCGFKGDVSFVGYGYRARYALPEEVPLVSLIILTRNSLKQIRQCITSIVQKTSYPKYEIIIVDNGSDDPATLSFFEDIARSDKIHILRDERPFNFAALNNLAVMHAKGEIIGLLSKHVEVISPDWMTEMSSHAIRPDVGAVGAKLLNPDQTIQHGGVVLGLGGYAGYAHYGFPKYSNGYFGRLSFLSSFSAVTSACLVVRKSVFMQVNGMNEKDLSIAYSDIDFCLRVRNAGYRNILTPYAELCQHQITCGYDNDENNQPLFARQADSFKQRWRELLINDPAYSPNLTLESADFSLAWPPRVEAV